jgi:hypothetical protein
VLDPVDPENSIGVLVKPIGPPLLEYIKEDERTARNAQGQTEYVDCRIQLLPIQRA